MKFNPKLPITSKALFTIVGGAVLINPVFAQEQASEELEEVVVTGLRGSLKASMETKRDAVGVVDAINAEDIGKFPDTNLSEALQRITGVSIDRRNGEGATVTARGFGPQFNMVTLNGRQMPSADAYGGGDAITGGIGGNSRAFNFANLAAEAISAVEVYKTGRADVATGGIGATINVRTARPLDNDGLVLNLGAKAVNDTTNRVGDDFTPEFSGIFSYATENKKFGIGVSASYAEARQWLIYFDRQRLAHPEMGCVERRHQCRQQSAAPLYVNNNNTPLTRPTTSPRRSTMRRPTASSTASRTTFATRSPTGARAHQRAGHRAVRASRRPHADSRLHFGAQQADRRPRRADHLAAAQWLRPASCSIPATRSPRRSELHEFTGASKDFGYEQQHREQLNDLNSIGFNASWNVAENFNLAADYHDSRAGSHPNDGITGGSQTLFSLAGKVPSTGNCARGRPDGLHELLDADVPVQQGPADRSAYAVPDQPGCLRRHRRQLGLQVRHVKPRFADSAHQLSGAEHRDQADAFGRQVQVRRRQHAGLRRGDSRHADASAVLRLEPDDGRLGCGRCWQGAGHGCAAHAVQPYGCVQRLQSGWRPTGGWKGNADVLGQWAIDHGYTNWTEASAPDGQLKYNPGFNTDSTVNEDTQAVYAQLALKFDIGSMPRNLVIGGRYETPKCIRKTSS